MPRRSTRSADKNNEPAAASTPKTSITQTSSSRRTRDSSGKKADLTYVVTALTDKEKTDSSATQLVTKSSSLTPFKIPKKSNSNTQSASLDGATYVLENKNSSKSSQGKESRNGVGASKSPSVRNETQKQTPKSVNNKKRQTTKDTTPDDSKTKRRRTENTSEPSATHEKQASRSTQRRKSVSSESSNAASGDTVGVNDKKTKCSNRSLSKNNSPKSSPVRKQTKSKQTSKNDDKEHTASSAKTEKASDKAKDGVCTAALSS